MTELLRGLVADDRIEMFKATLLKYVPDSIFSDVSDREIGKLRHDMHSHPYLRNVRGGRSNRIDQDWEKNVLTVIIRWAVDRNGNCVVNQDDVHDMPESLVDDMYRKLVTLKNRKDLNDSSLTKRARSVTGSRIVFKLF